MSVFVHPQGIKIVQAGGGGVKKSQNSVHVVVECPLSEFKCEIACMTKLNFECYSIHCIKFDVFHENINEQEDEEILVCNL